MTYNEKYILLRKKFILKEITLYNNTHSLNKFDINDTNFNIDEVLGTPEICQECDGKCCKYYPCLFSPYDFIDINSIDYMSRIIETGLICIGKSCYDNNLVLRPRGIKDKKKIVNTRLSVDNRCILFGPKGCMLTSAFRPAEALLYYAKSVDYHLSIYHTSECVDDWSYYQDILQKLYEKYKNVKTSILYEPTEVDVLKLTKAIAGYKK